MILDGRSRLANLTDTVPANRFLLASVQNQDIWQSTGAVMKAIGERVGDWAEVRRVPFSPMGADVPEL